MRGLLGDNTTCPGHSTFRITTVAGEPCGYVVDIDAGMQPGERLAP